MEGSNKLFKPIPNKNNQNFNTLVALPKFEDTWLAEADMSYILFLYYYIKAKQHSIDGHFEFRVNDFLLLLYSKASISTHWNEDCTNKFDKDGIQKINYKEKFNNSLAKLKKYQLLINDIESVVNKDDVITIPYENVTKDFENGFYTLFDYNIFMKIIKSEKIEKDLLFYCTLFLLNRARDNIGITSYEDIIQVLGSKTTIAKYLEWLKDNEVMDYYSTSHKLDDKGIPKRGNTFVATWKNKNLIEDIRSNDIVTKPSKEYLDPFDKRFAGEKYFDKSVKMIGNKYGLINNFLLYRLWNELPFEFTWECLYKYLNAGKNFDFFSLNDDGKPQTNKKKLVDKIVNVAKTQENDILQYIDELNDHIFADTLDELPFVGRVFEEKGYKIKSKKVKHLGNPKPFSSTEAGEYTSFSFDDDSEDYSNGYDSLTAEEREESDAWDRKNDEQIPEEARRQSDEWSHNARMEIEDEMRNHMADNVVIRKMSHSY